MLGAFVLQTLLMSNRFSEDMKLLYDVKILLNYKPKLDNTNCK